MTTLRRRISSGQLVMLDLDAQDRPHLVYSVFTNPDVPEGVVKYAVRQG